jgi:hypothetical protein
MKHFSGVLVQNTLWHFIIFCRTLDIIESMILGRGSVMTCELVNIELLPKPYYTIYDVYNLNTLISLTTGGSGKNLIQLWWCSIQFNLFLIPNA